MKPRILALDYGRVRLGLAVSDSLGLASHPLPALQRSSPGSDVQALRDIIDDREVSRLVIGLPLNMDGSEGLMAAEVRTFATWIGTAIGLPVTFEDERLSTEEAEEYLRSAGLGPSDRKKLRDSVAAAVILQTLLERERGPETPEPVAG